MVDICELPCWRSDVQSVVGDFVHSFCITDWVSHIRYGFRLCIHILFRGTDSAGTFVAPSDDCHQKVTFLFSTRKLTHTRRGAMPPPETTTQSCDAFHFPDHTHSLFFTTSALPPSVSLLFSSQQWSLRSSNARVPAHTG